eukprot:765232-Hanusia_phi.AAC.15
MVVSPAIHSGKPSYHKLFASPVTRFLVKPPIKNAREPTSRMVCNIRPLGLSGLCRTADGPYTPMTSKSSMIPDASHKLALARRQQHGRSEGTGWEKKN